MITSRRGFLSILAAFPIAANAILHETPTTITLPDEISVSGGPSGPFVTFARKVVGPAAIYRLEFHDPVLDGEPYLIDVVRDLLPTGPFRLPILRIGFPRANYVWIAAPGNEVLVPESGHVIIDSAPTLVSAMHYVRR